MIGVIFKSKANAVSEKDIENRKKSIPFVGQPVKVATTEKYAGKFALLNYSANNTSAHIPAWVGCREVFSGQFKKKTETFAFSHKAKCGENVAAFIAEFENKLKLKKNRTFFTLTDKDNIIIVTPSMWWKKYLVRRSLFTILLRAAQAYNIEKNNFEDALFSDPYAKETKNALKAFLEGQTFATRKSLVYAGWKATFAKKTDKQVSEILQKPPPKKPEVEPIVSAEAVQTEIDKQFPDEVKVETKIEKVEFPEKLKEKAKLVWG